MIILLSNNNSNCQLISSVHEYFPVFISSLIHFLMEGKGNMLLKTREPKMSPCRKESQWCRGLC